jgi:hypothetical protein
VSSAVTINKYAHVKAVPVLLCSSSVYGIVPVCEAADDRNCSPLCMRLVDVMTIETLWTTDYKAAGFWCLTDNKHF